MSERHPLLGRSVSVPSVAHASDLSDLRAYLATSHGTDYGASDDVLTALLGRADAYVAAGGKGGQYWLVGGWLREAYEGPHDG